MRRSYTLEMSLGGGDSLFLNGTSVLFEINEPDTLARIDACLRFATGVRAVGCGVAVGGFGRRSATFAPLKTLRPDLVKIDGVIVQRMAGEGVEMILGIKRDPLFGPVVLCGFGGILVEIDEWRRDKVAWARNEMFAVVHGAMDMCFTQRNANFWRSPTAPR